MREMHRITQGRDPKTWVLVNRENIETLFGLMV